MSCETTWRPGTFYRICDRCARKRYAEDTRLTWDNLMVCADTCWEPRQPQDFVRGVPDPQTVPNPRPRPADVFVSPGDVTPDDL